METKIGLTGATGIMGSQALERLLKAFPNERIRILVKPEEEKSLPKIKKLVKDNREHIDLRIGDIRNYDTVASFLEGLDVVFHLAALIPPQSEQDFQVTYDTIYKGTRNVVRAIEKENKTRLVYVSSVAIYGNRTFNHPWLRVGDPLFVSIYDIYGLSKIKAETAIMSSALKHWTIVRQNGVYHPRFLLGNLSDGLMFHTPFNSPLEWVTDRQSGQLVASMAKTLRSESAEELDGKIFNIGGREDDSRCTGYGTYGAVLKIMNGRVEKMFKADDNVLRNFHGAWFMDAKKLDAIAPYLGADSVTAFWKRIGKSMWYAKSAVLVPSALIKKLAIQRAYKFEDAPDYWRKHQEEDKIQAFFGKKNIPASWDDLKVWEKNEIPGRDYQKDVKAPYNLLSLGFDDTKKDEDLTIEDVRSAAEYRNLKLNSQNMEDLYQPLDFTCIHGHAFKMSAYMLLRGGHSCKECYEHPVWDLSLYAENRFYRPLFEDSFAEGEKADRYEVKINE